MTAVIKNWAVSLASIRIWKAKLFSIWDYLSALASPLPWIITGLLLIGLLWALGSALRRRFILVRRERGIPLLRHWLSFVWWIPLGVGIGLGGWGLSQHQAAQKDREAEVLVRSLAFQEDQSGSADWHALSQWPWHARLHGLKTILENRLLCEKFSEAKDSLSLAISGLKMTERESAALSAALERELHAAKTELRPFVIKLAGGVLWSPADARRWAKLVLDSMTTSKEPDFLDAALQTLGSLTTRLKAQDRQALAAETAQAIRLARDSRALADLGDYLSHLNAELDMRDLELSAEKLVEAMTVEKDDPALEKLGQSLELLCRPRDSGDALSGAPLSSKDFMTVAEEMAAAISTLTDAHQLEHLSRALRQVASTLSPEVIPKLLSRVLEMAIHERDEQNLAGLRNAVWHLRCVAPPEQVRPLVSKLADAMAHENDSLRVAQWGRVFLCLSASLEVEDLQLGLASLVTVVVREKAPGRLAKLIEPMEQLKVLFETAQGNQDLQPLAEKLVAAMAAERNRGVLVEQARALALVGQGLETQVLEPATASLVEAMNREKESGFLIELAEAFTNLSRLKARANRAAAARLALAIRLETHSRTLTKLVALFAKLSADDAPDVPLVAARLIDLMGDPQVADPLSDDRSPDGPQDQMGEILEYLYIDLDPHDLPSVAGHLVDAMVRVNDAHRLLYMGHVFAVLSAGLEDADFRPLAAKLENATAHEKDPVMLAGWSYSLNKLSDRMSDQELQSMAEKLVDDLENDNSHNLETLAQYLGPLVSHLSAAASQAVAARLVKPIGRPDEDGLWHALHASPVAECLAHLGPRAGMASLQEGAGWVLRELIADADHFPIDQDHLDDYWYTLTQALKPLSTNLDATASQPLVDQLLDAMARESNREHLVKLGEALALFDLPHHEGTGETPSAYAKAMAKGVAILMDALTVETKSKEVSQLCQALFQFQRETLSPEDIKKAEAACYAAALSDPRFGIMQWCELVQRGVVVKDREHDPRGNVARQVQRYVDLLKATLPYPKVSSDLLNGIGNFEQEPVNERYTGRQIGTFVDWVERMNVEEGWGVELR